jgi:hypothetical protein
MVFLWSLKIKTFMAEHTINWGRHWHRLMAILMLVNLALVSFNLSYVTLRGLYLRYTPALIHFYDPVLGIEPQPLTQTLRPGV